MTGPFLICQGYLLLLLLTEEHISKLSKCLAFKTKENIMVSFCIFINEIGVFHCPKGERLSTKSILLGPSSDLACQKGRGPSFKHGNIIFNACPVFACLITRKDKYASTATWQVLTILKNQLPLKCLFFPWCCVFSSNIVSVI